MDTAWVFYRELRERGCDGGYSNPGCLRIATLLSTARATMRFETESGEKAQVGWGSFGYVGTDDRKHRLWAL